MTKKLTLIIFCFLHLFSCNKEEKVIEELHINNSQTSAVADLTELVDSVELIRLETNAESAITSTINKIVYTDRHIYIADYNFGEYIAIFEADGSFVKKIRPSGEGPGEIADIRSFSVDEARQQIEVFSAKLKKSVIYSLRGEYIREETSDFYFNDKAWHKGQEYFFSKSPVNFSYFQDGNDYELFSKIVPIKKFPPSELIGNISLFSIPFFLGQDELLFCKPMQEIIYKLEKDQVIPKYVMQFAENPIPQNFWRVTKDLDRHAYVESKGYAHFFGNFFENRNILLLTYSYENARNWFVLDRNKKETLANSRLANIYGLELSPPHFIYKNGALYLIPAVNFKAYIANNKNKLQVAGDFEEVASQLSLTDNPVLIRVMFKS